MLSGAMIARSSDYVSEDQVPFLDVSIDHDNLLSGSAEVLGKAFPMWKGEDILLVQQTDGITKPSQTNVLIRTYGVGSDILIDRKQELMNMLVLSEKGLSPPLFCRFHNGLVYGFTDGKPLSVEDMQNPKIAPLVASHLARWHKVTLPKKEAKPGLFDTLYRWLESAPESFTSKIESVESLAFKTKAEVLDELHILRDHLETVKSPIVFSHCDLLSANIIYSAKDNAINFIDYEYGQYNPRGFDIGNHFCEYAGFDCDWGLYPSEAYQRVWLAGYLTSSNGTEPAECEVSKLYAEVNKYALAAHMFWGIWALVQSQISDLDFDYAGYAQKRFSEYLCRKNQFFSL
ncbi:hypothetical protein HDU67_007208 [Dinochytrium kinnereticum]|nr:hypothetical protein HDU67_007208 [Dinochytrium kinnereticum]